jgi:hypothetical protein
MSQQAKERPKTPFYLLTLNFYLLPHLLTGNGIGLISGEDIDITVADEFLRGVRGIYNGGMSRSKHRKTYYE